MEENFLNLVLICKKKKNLKFSFELIIDIFDFKDFLVVTQLFACVCITFWFQQL